MSEERQTSLAVPEPALDLQAAIAQHMLYLEVCKKLLSDDDYSIIRGKKHRKRSGWAKLRRAFSVSCAVVEERRIELADDWGYTLVIRAALPNGRFEDADGTCMASDLVKANMDPTEHNARSKALTRGKNRATSDILGAGVVSAEERSTQYEHWIDGPRAKAAFWAWTKGILKLSEEQTHEALKVESVKDFQGTMSEAKAILESYAMGAVGIT